MSYTSAEIKYNSRVLRVLHMSEETMILMPHAMCNTYVRTYICSYNYTCIASYIGHYILYITNKMECCPCY